MKDVPKEIKDLIGIKEFKDDFHKIAWHVAKRPSMYGVSTLGEYCTLLLGFSLSQQEGSMIKLHEFFAKKFKKPKNWHWQGTVEKEFGKDSKDAITKVYDLIEEFYNGRTAKR